MKHENEILWFVLILVTVFVFIAIAFVEVSVEKLQDQGKILASQFEYVRQAIPSVVADYNKKIGALAEEFYNQEIDETTSPQVETEPIDAFSRSMPEVDLVEKIPLGQFKIVAYYKGGNGLLTATGTTCEEGRTVAVDPKIIPYGTRLYIEGIGERISEDCGGFRGKVLDVFMKSRNDCLEFGEQYRKVWVIK